MHVEWRSITGLLLLGLTGFAAVAAESLHSEDPQRPLLHPLIADHAVIQRERPIRIWGWTSPWARVTVSLGTTTVRSTAEASGRWTATLPPRTAGGPFELTARDSNGSSQSVHDILVGDVWLCSGQSNMALRVRSATNAAAEIAAANNESIRMLSIPHSESMTPHESVDEPLEWQPAVPATVGDFSAVCYYFARELQKTAQVPLGLINASRGGTPIQPWISKSALQAAGAYEVGVQALFRYATGRPASSGASLYNGMIAPLGSFALRGVVWYQGEANLAQAARYRDLLAALMADWRRQFGRPLPFLIVQLPNFGEPRTAPGQSNWASLREAQRLAVQQDTHAGLAVTIDLGDRTNIHPTDKQDVGRRLARVARHVVYGEAISPSGPEPRGARREGDQVTVTFRNVEGSLIAQGGAQPPGFELCGRDPTSCRNAAATIEGDRILLSLPHDPGPDSAGPITPTTVRLCWADNPVCTLRDQSGLPAGPFELAIQ